MLKKLPITATIDDLDNDDISCYYIMRIAFYLLMQEKGIASSNNMYVACSAFLALPPTIFILCIICMTTLYMGEVIIYFRRRTPISVSKHM